MESPRDRLAAEKMQALQRLADLRHDVDAMLAASRDTNADDEHDPEGATIAFERSQIEAFVRQAEHHLEQIEVAAKKLDAGTYGTL
jgi:RNA polymerase-binding transcription factor DksA